MMKLLLPILALCIFLSPALATEPPTINMMFYRETSEPLLKEALKTLEKEHNFKVNLAFASINEIRALLVKGAMNNNLPDVIFVPSDFVSMAKDLKLSRIPEQLINPHILPNTLDSVSINNTRYGIPIIGGNHLVLFYNKKFVDKPASSWEELLQQAEQLKQKGLKAIGWSYGEMYWFSAFAGTFGAYPVTNGKLSLNTEAYINALQFYKAQSDSGLISVRCTYDCGHKHFIAEQSAYAINGEWAYADFERALGDSLGVALLPTIEQRPSKPMFSTVALLFPKQSLSGPKKTQLEALATFMQSSSFQDLAFEQERFLPVNKISFEKVENSDNENIRILLQQLKQAVPIPTEAIMANAWLGMAKGFYRHISGAMTAAEAASYMQKYAERDYQKSQKDKQ